MNTDNVDYKTFSGWIDPPADVLAPLEDDDYYSLACNGHGLTQAPYVGSLIADAIVDGKRHEDLEAIWAPKPKFPPFMMMGRPGLRTLWLADRTCDLLNGSKRRARRTAAVPVAVPVAETASAAHPGDHR